MTSASLTTFAIAVIICTSSATALAACVLSPRRAGRLLLWFGVFAGIYGVRMFFKQPLAAALDVDARTALWVEDTFNYVILVPSLLFAEALYGMGWRRSFRWLTIAMTAFAAIALAIDAVAGDPTRVPDPSMYLLVAVCVVLIAGARARYMPARLPEWRVLVAGIVIFLLFVVNDHAVGARVVPWRFTAEAIGFVALLGCLGYIAVGRFFAQGRQLAAIEQEMRSAREIQTSILPRQLPNVPGLHVAARYIPLAAVAGDFYDVVALNDEALALLVADVSGHGVPAALIASMVKVAFTAELAKTQDPGAILQRMNVTLCGMFDRSFVTAVCAVLSSADARLEYAAAGHPPPLLLPGNGTEPELLDARGMFLGMSTTATYSTAAVTLTAGARLIIYTDGVTETPAPAGDEWFGVDRLRSYARDAQRTAPDAFADGLMFTLERFAGSRALPHDDVTLVIIDIDDRRYTNVAAVLSS